MTIFRTDGNVVKRIVMCLLAEADETLIPLELLAGGSKWKQ